MSPLLLSASSLVITTDITNPKASNRIFLDPFASDSDSHAGAGISSVRWNHNNWCFSSAGRDGKIFVIHHGPGKTLAKLPSEISKKNTLTPWNDMDFGDHSRHLAAASDDGGVHIIDLKSLTTTMHLVSNEKSEATSCHFGARHSHIVSGFTDGQVAIHDVSKITKPSSPSTTNLPVTSLNCKSCVKCVRWCSSNTIAICESSGDFRVWDVSNHFDIYSCAAAHRSFCGCVASFGNRNLIFSGGDDGAMILHDIRVEPPTRQVWKLSSPVTALSVDGGYTVACGTKSGMIMCYDIRAYGGESSNPHIQLDDHIKYKKAVSSLSFQQTAQSSKSKSKTMNPQHPTSLKSDATSRPIKQEQFEENRGVNESKSSGEKTVEVQPKEKHVVNPSTDGFLKSRGQLTFSPSGIYERNTKTDGNAVILSSSMSSLGNSTIVVADSQSVIGVGLKTTSRGTERRQQERRVISHAVQDEVKEPSQSTSPVGDVTKFLENTKSLKTQDECLSSKEDKAQILCHEELVGELVTTVEDLRQELRDLHIDLIREKQLPVRQMDEFMFFWWL
eukprot:GHVL01010055.1.p1 GENE.GHVL01010055.1~~GHVL01010055.1.p1  ORF type:complete len:559 (+),score=82.15 GHVL01010055.1:169-1845(+)